MKFQFDGNQPYQLRAIEAVAGLFRGQRRSGEDYEDANLGELFGPVKNRLDLTDDQLLANLHAVQRQSGLVESDKLECIEGTIRTTAGERATRFPNFSVEMETGTGKTYVYLRTALELHRRYGLRKFIIVVPSVAIREGVLKTLEVTKAHLRALFDNAAYRYTVYDSRSITKVRAFAQSDCVEILVMTIDSFNKDDNVIRQSTDRLQGATPIYLIQSARPVLILDEPQNMESEGRIRALASLHPLFALRYSATHRNPYNLVYRLTPFDAYRGGLVKKIEVASVMKEDDFNQVFARVDEIRSDKTTIQAKIAVHQRMANGTIKEKAYLFRPGESLRKKADRPEYETFLIDEIDVVGQTVRFDNGIELTVGQAQGADQGALFREQIRYTVEEHFRKQKRLRAAGVKVLSLFFIDRVENYAGDAPAGSADHEGLYPGIIRKLFDEAFDDLKGGYPEFADRKPEDVRSAYFAQKSRKGGTVEQVDSTSGQSAEDRAAYTLIMKDKERLMSFREPVAFIFSHSALREGWDSPNVCQICTLNQSVSEVKKRQEVGRGMRLVVDQKGARVGDEKLNVLTVIANESYELFVEKLQAEMVEEFGKEGAPPRPTNAREKKVIRRKPLAELPPEFLDLWEKIKHKTRYQVSIDTPKLIDEVVDALDKLTIDPPRIASVKAAVTLTEQDEFVGLQKTGKVTLATLVGRQPVPNLVEMLEDLIAHITPPIKLTRRTLAAVVTRTKNRQAALDNPQEFAAQAARIVRDKAIHQLVHGIQYEKDGTWYDLAEWVEAEERSGDRLVAVQKSIYDHISCDSEVEREYAKKLGTRADVKLFVKLPAWFKVRTPIGNYNPDWGLVMEQTDAHGDAGPLLYLVRETKPPVEGQRDSEKLKIECGEAHFVRALGVDYKVVRKAEELP